MDTILNKSDEKKGINKGLLIGAVIGIVAIGEALKAVCHRQAILVMAPNSST